MYNLWLCSHLIMSQVSPLIMEEEQVLPNKIETDMKADLKMTGCKNMIKDTTLDIQRK